MTPAENGERPTAGCLGSLKCPCLCHDTGGGAHHHRGRVCDGQPGDYIIPSGGAA